MSKMAWEFISGQKGLSTRVNSEIMNLTGMEGKYITMVSIILVSLNRGKQTA